MFGVGYKTLPYSGFIGRRVVSDNMYLSILVETGIVGLAALLVLNFAILRAGYVAARSGDPERSFYGTWIFCFWTGCGNDSHAVGRRADFLARDATLFLGIGDGGSQAFSSVDR